MALLEIKNLSFSYSTYEQKVIDNVSLKINEGDFIVLCGSTGSGKTTFLKLLKREIKPFGKMSGDIVYRHKHINDVSEFESASEIGYVFQSPDSQLVCDYVYSELAFGLENLGVESGIIRRKVGEIASFFGITTWFKKKVDELSGGQKQILNLASVLVMQPKIILLDEPTSQLDPIAAREFLDTLERLNKELGITIIIVEHRLEEIFPIADKIMVMNQGRLIAFDQPQNISKQFDSKRSLIGLPSAVRIYSGLNINTECPLTVRDGKKFLSTNFKNDFKTLKINSIKRSNVIIDIKDLWFRYDKKEDDVLKGINLKIFEGEILSIVGSNGSGKSTLLKVISGLERAYRGKITLHNRNILSFKGNSLYRNNLALMPQDPQDLFIGLSVNDELNEIGSIRDLGKTDFEHLKQSVINDLRLNDLLDKNPYDVSGGEQQKIALAKMLLLEPKILMLDEPTKGFDNQIKIHLKGILKHLQANGITIIIVTHDIEFAARVSDRCSMIFAGEILSIDEPHNFFSGNTFYTTAANRISRGLYDNLITEEEVIELAIKNGVL